jgi:hypothetical protein
MPEKAPSKSFEERWNGFGFPDSSEDVKSMRGNCSGSKGRKRVLLLLLEM